jgi:hypothetical protein
VAGIDSSALIANAPTLKPKHPGEERPLCDDSKTGRGTDHNLAGPGINLREQRYRRIFAGRKKLLLANPRILSR